VLLKRAGNTFRDVEQIVVHDAEGKRLWAAESRLGHPQASLSLRSSFKLDSGLMHMYMAAARYIIRKEERHRHDLKWPSDHHYWLFPRNAGPGHKCHGFAESTISS
jgi:hypothetical protein